MSTGESRLNRPEERSESMECIVDFFYDEKGKEMARCTVMLDGQSVPVAFPRSVLAERGLKEHMRFQWFPASSIAEITPLPDPQLTQPERDELIERYRQVMNKPFPLI